MLIDVLHEFVRHSSDQLLLVKNGECMCCSPPLQHMLSTQGEDFVTWVTSVMSPVHAEELALAWNQSQEQGVTHFNSTIVKTNQSVEICLFKCRKHIHLVQLKVAIPDCLSANDHQVTADSENSDVYQGDDHSHPELPIAYRREAFFADVREMSGSSDEDPSAFSILQLKISDVDEQKPYWECVDACKAILIRLNDVVRGHDTIAHLGGAKFGIVQRHVISEMASQKLCERIRIAFSEPFLEESVPKHMDCALNMHFVASGRLQAEQLEAVLNSEPELSFASSEQLLGCKAQERNDRKDDLETIV